MKHTPGPWVLSDARVSGRYQIEHWTTNPNGHRWKRAVCELRDGNMSEGEPEANARLIAAAPEMAAALAAFVAFTSYIVNKRGSCVTSQHLALDDEDMSNAAEMLTDARALIARIDGTEWSGHPDPNDPDNFWIDDKTGERVNALTGERTKGPRDAE